MTEDRVYILTFDTAGPRYHLSRDEFWLRPFCGAMLLEGSIRGVRDRLNGSSAFVCAPCLQTPAPEALPVGDDEVAP